MPQRLSACLVVENDAARLPQCLRSLGGWADEIVVIDLGSTDETVAIAESYGAQLAHFAWCDDDSAARNAALAHATGDWILAIDADETLVVEDPAALRAALASAGHDACFMRVVGPGPDGDVFYRPEARLFRRDPRIRFYGRAHAQVDTALRVHRQRLDALLGVSLEQAADRPARRATSGARDRRLAEWDVAERSHAPDAWLALGRCCAAAGDDEDALRAFEHLQALVARTGESTEMALERLHTLAALYARLGRPLDAAELIEQGPERLPEAPLLRFERARARAERGDFAGAIADLRVCLRGCTGRDMRLRPRDLPARAEALLTHVLARAPELADEAACDRRAELRTELAENPRQPERWLELAFLCFQQACLDEALEAGLACIELNAGLVPAFHLLGMALDRSGQPGYAERAFEASLVLEPNNPLALSCRDACRGKVPARALDPEVGARIERALKRVHPAVSACLIVKNEAEKLGRCLTSLQGWVAEIVVLDTGSTDETVAVAESFGAKVRRFAWCDDFAAARNASIEQATGDWILAIDADEELVVDDPEGFRKALRNLTVGGYLFTQRNLTDTGSLMSSPALRLFQRHARIRFANRLHENVADALLKLGWPVSELHAMAVAHDGYLEASMQSQDKEGRNRRIAWAAAEASPENPSHWYELGRACVGAPEGHAEALAAFARVEQLLAAGAELSEAAYPRYVSLYQGLLHQVGRIDEAQALLDEAIARYPGHAELHYRRGLLRTQHGDREGARRDFLACLTPNAYMASQRREGITWELPNRALAELEAQVAADSAN